MDTAVLGLYVTEMVHFREMLHRGGHIADHGGRGPSSGGGRGVGRRGRGDHILCDNGGQDKCGLLWP